MDKNKIVGIFGEEDGNNIMEHLKEFNKFHQYKIQVSPLEDKLNHLRKEILGRSAVSHGLINSKKALDVVVDTMNSKTGFHRHDGNNYYIHLVEVSQAMIDFGLIDYYLTKGDYQLGDNLLATALLHDIIEDVDEWTYERVSEEFNPMIALNVQLLSKTEELTYTEYVKGWSSEFISSMVKLFDLYNNMQTLSLASDKHRYKYYFENKNVFIPLSKQLRYKYWEHSAIIHVLRTNIKALNSEIERELLIKDYL